MGSIGSIRTGAQMLWESLVREGVSTVFGYPGGAILPAYDALLEYPIRHVLVRHEQGATHMADGYARASGGVGVAIATSGPGATNMVTGIATAMLDSSPIVCITGQVGSKAIGSDAFQETDVTGVTLPITKHNYLVSDVSEVAPTIHEAFYVARSGRPGPVLVDITKDAQQASGEFVWDPGPVRLPGYRPDLRASDAEYQQAVELINNAKRPIIFAGHGVMLSGATELVRELAEAGEHPDCDDLAGHRLVPGVAPPESRDDGDARRSLGEPGDSGSGSAPGVRHAVRRPGHRQRQDLRAKRAEDSHRHRPGRVQQERHRGPGAGGRSGDRAARPAAEDRAWRPQRLARHHYRGEGRLGGPRRPEHPG